MFFSWEYIVALLVVLTFHEAAHALVAFRLGDPTAQRMGRLSLNPLRHLDLLGTLMMFFAGIGWGKPVPVNPSNFKDPVRDEALTALAGPTANLLLAVVAAFFVSYLPDQPIFQLWRALSDAILNLSLVLFLFNMLPFGPMDGAKFLRFLIPKRSRATFEALLAKTAPYLLVLMVLDFYLSPKWFGFSILWTGISTLTFWLRTALLVVV
jgi:Zn-dependent protease